MLSCIPRNQAERIKTAFQEEGMSIERLSDMSSKARQGFFEKYLGEGGKDINLLFEKALASNQRQAIINWVWKTFEGHKPLYSDVLLGESKAMREAGLNVRKLKGMSSEERVNELSNFVDSGVAKTLNDRFETALKSGTLSNWEERVLGTKEVHADKQLQGAFARIEALKDAGLMTPAQTEKFMEGLVSKQLGVDVTAEQSAEIARMVDETGRAFDQIRALDDWTGNNSKAVEDYFIKRHQTEQYVASLGGKDAVDIANDLVTTARNNILGSFRSLRNSALYQVIPSLERAFTKRITSVGIGDPDYTFIDKLSAKVSEGLIPDREGQKFIKDQLDLTLRIYHKTGYDISRMEKLDMGQTYIGEREKAVVPGKPGIGKITGQIAKMTSVFPKWFAGGTDTVIAATTRAETSWLWSREQAKLEAKKGKLPQGVTEKQRADQLLRESYAFDPKDPRALLIRGAALQDANFSNNTQPDGMADMAVMIRGRMKIGNVEVGRVIAPFAKISTTALSRGLQTAIPIGVAKSLRDMHRASQQKDISVKQRGLADATTRLIGFLGLTGTSIAIAALLDEDDYVPPYVMLNRKEYEEARARGAQAGSIKVGGKWVPLRYLPLVGPMVSAIMNARKVKSEGGSAVSGYIGATLASVLDAPVLTEVIQLADNVARTTRATDAIGTLNNAGMSGEDIWDWARVRVVPSMLGRDLYDAVLPPEAKYDFLGREVDRGGAFRNDKTNELLIEFSRLNQGGFGPVISDYSGKEYERVVEKYGEKFAEDKMVEFKQKYHQRVESLLGKEWYQAISDEEKQKEIDKIRQETIIDGFKQL